MVKPPIIGFVMAVAGVACVVFLALLFLSGPVGRSRTPAPAMQFPRKAAETRSEPAAEPPGNPAPPLHGIQARPPRRPKTRRHPLPAEPPAKPDPQPEPPALQAVFTVQDTQPPRLSILMPKSPAYQMEPRVTIRARSEAGARVRVGQSLFIESAIGVYVANVNLHPGLNRLEVTASDAVGNTSSKTLLVTYIEPSRVEQVKDDLMSMLKQLEEIKQSVDEVDSRTDEIINAIADTEDADRVNELSRNLREIRRTKRALQKEIEKAFGEINALLAKRKR